MTRVEKAVKFMENIANDNSHGYSQINRNGNPDYDCSSLVITAFEKAGFPVTSKYGATYTGNMKQAFLRCNFKDVKSIVNLQTGADLKRGDILLNENYHVAVYLGNNKIVHARMDENGGIKGILEGDQTGQEISITPYYSYSKGWDCVLRYEEQQVIKTEKKEENISVEQISEKERKYAQEAINTLAELELLNSPETHIKNIDKSNWALWVMMAKLGEKIGEQNGRKN